MLSPLVIYHAKAESIICFDGFCAATIVWKKYGDSAEYVKAFYYTTLPLDLFEGRDVIFVDFSYDVAVMDQINAVATSLLVLDHHMPRAESFLGRDYAHFGAHDCGSTMAWKHFFCDEPMPLMLTFIDDGDRALNLIPDLGTFNASLSVEEQTFSNWSNLLDTLSLGSTAYESFMTKGRILNLYDTTKVKLLVREAFPITLCGKRGLAVNTNKFYGHRVATKLAENSGTFGATFYFRSDGNVEVSLRRVDPDVNVHEIAYTFGGGGHPGAAGFSVSIEKFNELFYNDDNKTSLFSQIDTAVKTFQHTLDLATDADISHIEEKFLEHLQKELGANIADYLGFSITKSVSHPSLLVRFLSSLAIHIGLAKLVPKRSWYHKFFPYVLKRELAFDEDSIKNVLIESKPGNKDVNTFFVQRLMETVEITYPAELITSTYYIHVEVKLPDSPLTIKHTFEVSK